MSLIVSRYFLIKVGAIAARRTQEKASDKIRKTNSEQTLYRATGTEVNCFLFNHLICASILQKLLAENEKNHTITLFHNQVQPSNHLRKSVLSRLQSLQISHRYSIQPFQVEVEFEII